MLNLVNHWVNVNKVQDKNSTTIRIIVLENCPSPKELQYITSVGMNMDKSETLSMVGGKIKGCSCYGE